MDTADTMKCALKPLDRVDDYGPLGVLTFTDAQWVQLQAAFPGRRVRLQPAGGRPAADGHLAHLPERGGRGDLRRHTAAARADRVAPGWVSEAFFTPLPDPGQGALLGVGTALVALLARARRRL